MKIDSNNIEFGYELISVIPYANYLSSKGLLTETISGNDTECLYYFSPKHNINKKQRSWFNTKFINYPNINIHKPSLDKKEFLPPDYKKQYANDRFKFKNETVIICNRHNVEWSTKPINYFDIPTLKKIFGMLKDYQVIYINIDGLPELYDNAPPIPLGDFEIIKEYDNVINIHDLHKNNKDLSFNELQLMLFANCSKFITMNGGHSILASYFGGENIIMSKPGNVQAKEILPQINSYYRWYYEFGKQRCIHVKEENELIEKIKTLWIDKEPIVNILVRTAGRPNYFKECIKSIQNQTYKNINIFVSIDSDETYTYKYPVYPIYVDRKQVKPIEISQDYGKPMPYNLYFNKMYDRISSGLVLYLDDDDQLNDNKALEKIVNEYKKGAELIFWRVKIGRLVIPRDEHWKKQPVLFNMSGIGFAFDSKYTKDAIWEPYKRGDYRVANKLYSLILYHGWIDEILARTQDGSHFGALIDKRNKLKIEDMEKLVKVKINNPVKGSKYVKGTIEELPLHVANQLVKLKIANYITETIKEVEPVEKVNKIVDHNVVKRGRKKVK